jgi:hypothetical protein
MTSRRFLVVYGKNKDKGRTEVEKWHKHYNLT